MDPQGLLDFTQFIRQQMNRLSSSKSSGALGRYKCLIINDGVFPMKCFCVHRERVSPFYDPAGHIGVPDDLLVTVFANHFMWQISNEHTFGQLETGIFLQLDNEGFGAVGSED